jgi:ATP-dependent Clp protease ATP-binding subunit ClpA
MEPRATAFTLEAFSRALDETRRLSHASVRAEHILLALLQLTDGSAAAALDAAGAHRSEAARGLEELLPPAEAAPHPGEYPYHPSGAALIGRLIEEFPPRQEGRITSGRVLLGLLRLGNARIEQALAAAGVDIGTLASNLAADPDGAE